MIQLEKAKRPEDHPGDALAALRPSELDDCVWGVYWFSAALVIPCFVVSNAYLSAKAFRELRAVISGPFNPA